MDVFTKVYILDCFLLLIIIIRAKHDHRGFCGYQESR